LLILDNVESVLQCHTSSANATNGTIAHPVQWEEWTLLLHALSQGRHQSCVVLTSREEPKIIQRLSGNHLPIRVLPLQGLSLAEAQHIFNARDIFQGTPAEWSQLVDYYDGNPLFLETDATTIQHLFAGNLAAFLSQRTLIFDEIQELLDQQLDELPHLEQTIVTLLARQKTSIGFTELRSRISSKISTAMLLASVQSLRVRSLLSRSSEHYCLPRLLMNYINERYPGEQSVTISADNSIPFHHNNFSHFPNSLNLITDQNGANTH